MAKHIDPPKRGRVEWVGFVGRKVSFRICETSNVKKKVSKRRKDLHNVAFDTQIYNGKRWQQKLVVAKKPNKSLSLSRYQNKEKHTNAI